MKLWFKNFRISVLNWLAGGRLTINKFEKPQEQNTMSNYSAIGQLAISPNGNMVYNTGNNINMQNKQTLTIKITPANGGTIITTQTDEYSGQHEFHVIPDGADFDRELGKIITLNKLKS